MIETTRCALSVNDPTLYIAFELGLKNWKLAMTSSPGAKPWIRTIASGDLTALRDLVTRGKVRYGLAASAPVVSCYEAGRDGFWIDRALATLGIANRVVDSASIEVNRRARRSKTDRLDVLKLVAMLMRVCGGESGVWHEVRVPTVADEACRHSSRERTQLVQDATRIVNQMRSVAALSGCKFPERRRGAWWAELRDWNNQPLPAPVQHRLAHAQARLALLEEQIADLTTALEQQQQLAAPGVARLTNLKGIGVTSAAVLLAEGLLWRAFQNRRQVGGFLGFRPVPYQSGEDARDVGIDCAGNTRWRATIVQLAWSWLQWQPSSELAQWYTRRFAAGGRRVRRIGIVALARKLLIALWRYAATGIVPEGAILKVA